MSLFGAKARLADGINIFSRSSKDRHSLLIRIVEESSLTRIKRRSVVKKKGAAGEQSRHQPVPHHPSTSSEIEESIIPLKIGVKEKFCQMLEENAAGTMDDAFRHSRGAGRIKNEDRMIKRKPGEGERW